MGIGEGSPITVPSENNILQNFSDATAGRSLQLFYCVGTTDSAGVDYVMVRDSGVSLPVVTNADVSFDIDFDITINKPTIIAGIATIDVTYGGFGGGAARNVNIEFKLIHYDGSTETEIGVVNTKSILVQATFETTKLQFTVTKQLFGIGNVLRLTAKGNGVEATRGVALKHNPQTAGDELKLWLPIVNLE